MPLIFVTLISLSFSFALFIHVYAQQRPDQVVVKSDTMRTISIAEFNRIRLNPNNEDKPALIGFAELAALAANIYMPDGEFEAGCNPSVEKRIAVPGWDRLRGWSEPKACNAAQNGLQYEVWGKHTGGIMHIAVVFRGTVATNLAHWCANLRSVASAFCDPKSDQYLAIAGLIDDVMSGTYDDWGPDRYLYAVGHSLGGGLAELAGRSSYISKVITFNSSPVTGDDILRLVESASRPSESQESAMKNLESVTQCGYWSNNPINGDRIDLYRVYEDFDILRFPRLLNSWNQPLQPESRTTEYRTNLLSGNPLNQHSMKQLACALKHAG